MNLKRNVAAAVLAIGIGGAAHAADINAEGAKDLLGNLTHFLPEDLANSGFITVTPADNRYKVTYDLAKLVAKMKTTDFIITGLKPLTAFATPQDGGLWAIEGSNAIDVTAKSTSGPDMLFRYALASSTINGVFDPALHYMKSMETKGTGITIATRTSDNGVQKNDVTVDSVGYTLSSASSSAAGKLDMQINGGLQALYDKISSDTAIFGEFRIGSINFNANATSIPLKQVNDVIQFVSDHKDAKTLSDSDSASLKNLLLNLMPVVGSFGESVSARDISVTTPLGNGGLQKLDYSLKIDGPSKATDVNLGVKLEKFKLASDLVPQDYVAFIPEVAEVQVGVPNLNLAAISDVIQQTDFNKPESSEEGKEAVDDIQKAMFPDGTITITYPKVSATSNLYDIEASGSMRAWLDDKDRVSMQFTVLARDLDKTIAAIQDAAKNAPDLNQVSLGLMMAKGFAKTDPDGRSRWEISLADDKSVTINGQLIK